MTCHSYLWYTIEALQLQYTHWKAVVLHTLQAFCIQCLTENTQWKMKKKWPLSNLSKNPIDSCDLTSPLSVCDSFLLWKTQDYNKKAILFKHELYRLILCWQHTYWEVDWCVPCCTEEQIQDWNSRKEYNVNSLSQFPLCVSECATWARPTLLAFALTWIQLESCLWWWAAQTVDKRDKLLTLWTDCQYGRFSSKSRRTGALRETLGLQVVWPGSQWHS